MKFLRIIFGVIILAAFCFNDGFSKSGSSSRSVPVKGYTRKDGTYVAPHYRSAPNSTKSDNWSTKGNVNPYTGKPGTKDAGEVAPTASVTAGRSTDGAPKASTSESSSAQDKNTSVSSKENAGTRIDLAWGQLKTGMTKGEVFDMLGEPNIKSDRKWLYVDGGLITFAPDGKVAALSAPKDAVITGK